MDKVYTNNDSFTLFIVFKHDSGIDDSTQFLGLGNNINPNFVAFYPPYIRMDANKLYLRKGAGSETSGNIFITYKNSQIMLWFTKNGNNYELNLCDKGGNIKETFTPQNYSADRILIRFKYKIQRFGFSQNHYAVNGSEFHKILFMEKSKGTFFDE